MRGEQNRKGVLRRTLSAGRRPPSSLRGRPLRNRRLLTSCPGSPVNIDHGIAERPTGIAVKPQRNRLAGEKRLSGRRRRRRLLAASVHANGVSLGSAMANL